MAGIINTIVTKFKTDGAANVAKNVDNISKAQTRLGQSSASAGRSFAAQSQGLGGLVGAYAGAAATVFALQAAFAALNSAAKAENIVKGTNALAATVAANGPKILQNIKDITNGQITMAEAAQSANIALSAGFSTTQIDDLTAAALKTSKALGRDLTDSLTRLVRGTAKLEPELLDELGIFVRIEPATRKYAKQLGVAASSLTEYQRRQAFVNATIEEADRKFSSINTSAPTSQQSLERLNATIVDLSNVLGALIADILAPLADFFAKDIGNAVTLFGGILLLVFGKAKSMIAAFTASSLASFNGWVDSHVTGIEKVRASYAALTTASTAYAASITDRGGLLPKNANNELDRTGSFNQQGIPRDVSGRLAKFRQEFRGGTWTTIGIDQLKDKLSLLDDDMKKYGGTLRGVANKDAVLMQTALRTAIDSTTKRTKVLTGGMGLLKKGIGAVGKAAGLLFSAFSWIFGIVSILELLGFDVFGTLISWFTKTREQAESFGSGLAGAFVAASGGAEILTQKLLAAGATQDDLDNLNSSILELYTSLENTVATSKGIAENLTYTRVVNFKTDELADLQEKLASLEDTNSNVIFRDFRIAGVKESIAEVEAELAAAISEQQDALNNLKLPSTIREAASIELGDLKLQNMSIISDEDYKRMVMLEGLITMLDKIPEEGLTIIGGIARLGGLDSAKVADELTGTFNVIKNSAGELSAVTVDGFLVPLRNGVPDLGLMDEKLRDALVTTVTLSSTITEVFDTFASGNTSLEKLENQIGGIESAQAERNNNLAEAYAKQGKSVDEIVSAIQARNAAENISLNLARETAKIMAEVADTQKNIQNSFGSEIRMFDTAAWDGIVSAQNTIATNDVDIANNRAKALTSALEFADVDRAKLETLEAQKTLTEEEAAEYQKLVARAELFDTAVKASVGSLMSAYVELTKMTKEQEKQIAILDRQKTLQTQETNLQILQQEVALQEKIADIKLEGEQRALDIAKARVDLQETYFDNSIQQLESLDNVLSNLRDNSNAPAKYLQQQLEAAKQFSEQFVISVGSPDALVQAYEKVMRLSQEPVFSDSAETDRRMAIVEYEIEGRKAIQAAQLDLFDKETGLMLAKIQSDIDSNMLQYDLLQAQADLDKARLEADKANIQSEKAILEGQINAIQGYAIATDGFGSAVTALASTLDQFLKNLPEWLGGGGGIDIPDLAKIQGDVLSLGGTAIKNVGTITDLQIGTLNEQIRGIEATLTLKKEQLNAELFNLIDLYNDTTTQRGVERQQLIAEQEGVIAGLNDEIADLGTAAAGGGEKVEGLTGRLASLQSSIDSSVTSALMSLNDLIFYGEGSAQEIAYAFFRSIQETLYEELIAKPLSNIISNWITGGINTLVGGVDIMGSPLTGEVGSVAGATGDALTQNTMGQTAFTAGTAMEGLGSTILQSTQLAVTNITTAQQQFATAMQQFGGGTQTAAATAGVQAQTGGQNLAQSVTTTGSVIQTGTQAASVGVQAAGTTFMSALSSFWPILLMMGLTALISKKASGGMIQQFASGGSPLRTQQLASGGQLRDRVPALLEPGEFVIRRPAARAIGGPALRAMNATGNVSGGAPIINVTNEGSPKNVESAAPKFDGEKYVIDIVMRDLSNNGPIRRSIRGKGGRV